MIEKIISGCLRQRFLVLMALVGLSAYGIYSAMKLPVDAFPDVTTIQVQVITTWPGMSPVEVEQQVTFPIEVQMAGLPDLVELRSLSKFGLSLVTVVFEDSVDIYFARQLVLERLLAAREKLPPKSEPVLGPISTGLGEIYQYTLEEQGSPAQTSQGEEVLRLMRLRTVQDAIVRPLLKTVPGVTDVNTFGGYVRQYQVNVDPDRLRKYDLSLHQVFSALAANNANAGGNILEKGSEQALVRGIGLMQSVQDIEEVVLKEVDGAPVLVRDVAVVREGPATRLGAVVKDGKAEAVAGIVLMIRGGSGREVVAAVKEKVKQINQGSILPKGVKLEAFYDRAGLVRDCINTVSKAITEGVILVIFIVYLFLRSFRGALVIALTLPLVALVTFIAMRQVGLSANLMSLGGLAISIGMIVDGAVIQVENVMHRLGEANGARGFQRTVLEAVLEVVKPSLFGVLIIAITFLPLMTLQGMEGKMFAPLAFTVAIALLASLLLSISAIPALCSFIFKPGPERPSPLMRAGLWLYRPALAWALQNRKMVVLAAGGLLVFSLAMTPFLGTEFIPRMDEGYLTPQVIRLPSVSMAQSLAMERQMQQVLLKFPEVVSVVSKVGTPEIGTDPMGPELSDPIVILKPRREWRTARTSEELMDKMRTELAKIPGVKINFSQPIALRVDELISGVKSQVAVKIFGDDMEILRRKAEDAARLLKAVRGVTDLRVEQVAGQPYLNVKIDRRRIARYGVNVADIQEVIETAVGGKAATEVIEGPLRVEVALRFPEERRNSLEAIGNILIDASGGRRIPLAELARITEEAGPVQVSRENARRRVVVEFNVEGRDIGGLVAEGQRLLEARLGLPPGYYLTWGGAFENQQRAMHRLMVIVPVTVLIIFLLLFMTFNSLRYATLVIVNLPLALIGGILGLLVTGLYLSVPASVGFIALFGVAVLNGVVLVSYINQLRQEGLPLEEAVRQGCERRLRPVLMTATVAILGLIPLLFATGPGSEVQRPLAVVVVSGLFTSTLLTLIVLPVLYGRFAERLPEI
ncbi:MAG: cytochrome-c peroxidase [Deltaproteobacteria bacterium RBG_13_58_19]|jgi:cobalt-zinc-cadmium resistance protein CzcA|nr:MAG: cytochrome-c peroxidase [Deltaproteobacteria bacterium RBG_13_58_19]